MMSLLIGPFPYAIGWEEGVVIKQCLAFISILLKRKIRVRITCTFDLSVN